MRLNMIRDPVGPKNYMERCFSFIGVEKVIIVSKPRKPYHIALNQIKVSVIDNSRTLFELHNYKIIVTLYINVSSGVLLSD
jgi:hypothetical protein